jgi:hypothetical protein
VVGEKVLPSLQEVGDLLRANFEHPIVQHAATAAQRLGTLLAQQVNMQLSHSYCGMGRVLRWVEYGGRWVDGGCII